MPAAKSATAKSATAKSSAKSATKPARPYVVRNSRIHGRGVFATGTIRKGTQVIEYRGERTSWELALTRPPSNPDDPNHTFFFEISDGRVIDANVRGNAARWINHACDANCESSEDEDGRVFIEARRTIRVGEELTYDYKLSLDGRLSKRTLKAYACRCGSDNCSGSLLVRPESKPKAVKAKAKANAKPKPKGG